MFTPRLPRGRPDHLFLWSSTATFNDDNIRTGQRALDEFKRALTDLPKAEAREGARSRRRALYAVPMTFLLTTQRWAQRLKRDVVAVYFAARDPETPPLVRLLAFAVAAYALSPIDLIPDFIPVLGYLDDLLMVPLGLLLVIRLLPPHVLDASRTKASAMLEHPRSLGASIVFVIIWIACLAAVAYCVIPTKR